MLPKRRETSAMTATTTDHADARQVLTLATPDLYRKNLFRVLGIPVTATPQDVRRSQRKRDMARRLGADHGPVDGHELLALRDPDEENIRIALEHLNDPKSRLLDEIFWFWPTAGDGANDPGLAALERGDVQGALDAWAAGGSENAELWVVKAHNRAVLNHLIALEFDAWIVAQSNPRAGSAHYQDPKIKARALWGNALGGWGSVLDSELFWQRVKLRIDEMNDPQLTTEMVHRIRETLPEAVLNINAQIALRAVERGDKNLAEIHLRLLHQATLSPAEEQRATYTVFVNDVDGDTLSPAEEVLRATLAPIRHPAEEVLWATLAPIRHRIESLCEQATRKAADDAEYGDKAASDLLEQTKPLLHTLDVLLADQDVLRSGTHDAVAEAALTCLIAYGNKTERWGDMVRLLDVAIPVAGGAALRARMEENRKQVQRNHEDGVCYFCGEEKSDPAKVKEVKMYGDVKLEYPKLQDTYLRYLHHRSENQSETVKITWRHVVILIPRCKRCAFIHDMDGNKIFCILLFLVGILTFIIFAIDINGSLSEKLIVGASACFFGSVFSVIPIAITTNILTSLLLSGRKNEKEFIAVKDLLAKGWEFGEKPPSAS